MSVGGFLGKVGQALNKGITAYQRTRDFGPDYQRNWDAEQAYLNRFAADREAEKTLARARQAQADTEHTEDRKAALEDRARKRRDELALALEGAYVPNEANPEQLFLDQGTADQLLLGASPEDRAFALATSRAKVSKTVQAEKKKREQGLKALKDELDIRGGYERGLIGARSAADAAGEKRRSDAAIAQALTLGALQPLLNLGKPKTGAVDPYLALAAREGMPDEAPEDTIARAEAFRHAEQLRLRGGGAPRAAAASGIDADALAKLSPQDRQQLEAVLASGDPRKIAIARQRLASLGAGGEGAGAGPGGPSVPPPTPAAAPEVPRVQSLIADQLRLPSGPGKVAMDLRPQDPLINELKRKNPGASLDELIALADRQRNSLRSIGAY